MSHSKLHVTINKKQSSYQSQENVNNSFLSMIFKEGKNVKIYSYNQLYTILDYFGDTTEISTMNSNFQQVFDDCHTVKQAKKQLEYLGTENFSKDLWKVAKTLEWRKSSKFNKYDFRGVKLHEGDIIKMGRLKIKLKSIHMDSSLNDGLTAPGAPKATTQHQEDIEHIIDYEKDISFQISSDKNEEIPPCRICLSNEMDEQLNPLINPCACKGTQGLLHVECLKSWMTSKRIHKCYNQYSESFTWKTVDCELCHKPYPFKI